MRCPACRVDSPGGSRFCPSCGAALDAAADVTRLSGDETRLSPGPPLAASTPTATPSGWLSASGSIDHGRFTPGTVLADRYRVTGLLGRGGMGEVAPPCGACVELRVSA